MLSSGRRRRIELGSLYILFANRLLILFSQMSQMLPIIKTENTATTHVLYYILRHCSKVASR